MTKKLLILAACAALIAPAAAVGATVGSQPDPRAMVLRLVDMPAGYEYDGVPHYGARGDRPAGWVASYDVNFERGGLMTAGAAESGASVWKSSAIAHAEFLEGRAKIGKQRGMKRLSIGEPIGHEAVTYAREENARGFHIVGYIVVWRYGPVIAMTFVGGVDGVVSPTETLDLARKQQERIEAATA